MTTNNRYTLLLAILMLCAGCADHGGGGSGGGGGTFTITTTTAPFGVVDNSYSTTLTTANGTAPFTWTLFSGAVPTGLTPINPATGALTGTPTVAGNFTATFTVRDSTGKTATGSVLFSIHPKTDRVSVNTSGNSVAGSNTEPSINQSGGRFIAFVSTGSLLSGVTGQQVYIHDRQTGQPSLVSKDNSALGNPGNGNSDEPSVSSDGRFVAFVSQSTNLLAPAVPSVVAGQVYVRDTQTGVTTLISRDSSAGLVVGNAASSAPSISGDGRFVTFVSTASNLVTGVSGTQIYLRDTQTGQTSLVSKDNNVAPNPGGGVSSAPAISADGSTVTFASQATNLLAPTVPSVTAGQVYVRNLNTGVTSVVSRDSTVGLVVGNAASSAPSISGDGRFVTFVSTASNLVTGVSGTQIYLRDTQTGQTSLVSKDNNVAPNPGGGVSSAPAISSDGRYVTFVSLSTNLLAPGTPTVNGLQVYLRDTTGNVTSLVSQDNSGNPSTAGSNNLSPSITTNGTFVAFVSSATNLVTSPPAAAALDIYVRALP